MFEKISSLEKKIQMTTLFHQNGENVYESVLSQASIRYACQGLETGRFGRFSGQFLRLDRHLDSVDQIPGAPGSDKYIFWQLGWPL